VGSRAHYRTLAAPVLFRATKETARRPRTVDAAMAGGAELVPNSDLRRFTTCLHNSPAAKQKARHPERLL